MTGVEAAEQARLAARAEARRAYWEARELIPDDDDRAIARLRAECQAKFDAADRQYWHDADKALDRAINSIRRAA